MPDKTYSQKRSFDETPEPAPSVEGDVDPTVATPGNWLEAANNDGASPFTVRDPALMMNRSFNDRIAVIDKNP